MRRLKGFSMGILLTLGLCGCPTTFSGSAHVVSGRAGCEQKCKESKMRLSGMVFLGEYSSACVCEIPPKPGAAEKPAPSAGAAAVGAAVGVMGQTAHADDETAEPLLTN